MVLILRTVGFVVAVACFNAQCVLGKGKISCKDDKGKDVDWFVLYKLPKTKPTSGDYMSLNGEQMAYRDSRSKQNTWTLLKGSIYNTSNNPVKETLDPIYRKEKDVAYAAYNDQLPEGFKGTRGGHTKGILMAGIKDKMGTVWLQHSVPRFIENIDNGYEYPKSGRENGQLFFCISTNVKSADIIAVHLFVQAANVYQTNAPHWAETFPAFWNLLHKKYPSRTPKDLRVDFLLTKKKKLVMAIAKPPNWPKDIYTEELGRQMNDSIVVQSWQNGAGGAQTKHCSKTYSVTDVTVIGVRTAKGSAVFSSREDHSKWYVTRHKGVFCFSSLNRMLSQMKRGGEITCIIDIPLADLFRKSIAERSTCKNE
uniref:Uncharacterized protein n=1 Tax=Amblyomma maculatum TaxID=34609 RepID=G3MP01_AMBMU